MLKLKENSSLALDHYNTIKGYILDGIDYYLRLKHIIYDKVKIELDDYELDILRHYKNEANLKALITMNPTDLTHEVDQINQHHKDYIDKSTKIYKVFDRVFISRGYNNIVNMDFIQKIGIDSCPYCNRNYIYYISDGSVKPELDHFYAQSIYPIFGSSYYNLIPSCQTCNGIACKHKSDSYVTRITSPYLINSDDFKFSFRLNSLSRINPISGKSSVDVLFDKKKEENAKLFKLEELYALHADHVLELYVKSQLKYGKKYRSYLKSYNFLKFSDQEIDRLILGNYSREKELHKRPLSKLYSDIGKKLGIITDYD